MPNWPIVQAFVRRWPVGLATVTEKLQIEVTAEEIEERIAQLKASILKEESEPAAEKLAEESEEVMDDGRPLAPSQAEPSEAIAP